ncbi:hypothetical protein TKK_0018067 [Trichogramma kaykai]|uniref:DNA-(apurinic or apyrimidinic site) endonuclease n=1 Tax=Trichogramma kaykai TaxID=54128 RepID=A0ABD2W1C9_9HYME
MPPKRRGRPPKAKPAETNEGKAEPKKKRIKESSDKVEVDEPVRKRTRIPKSKNQSYDENEDYSNSEIEQKEKAGKKKGAKRGTKVKPPDENTEPIQEKYLRITNKTETNLNEIDFECHKENADGEKADLKICSWNVAGFRAVVKKKGIEYLLKEDADIIALQETNCKALEVPEEAKLEGYFNYFTESVKNGYCGMALFSKVEPISITGGLQDLELDTEARVITAEFDKFYLINVYVPNAGQSLVTLPKRLKWNQAFQWYVQGLDKKKPVIICGDMNVAHLEIDLKDSKNNRKNAGYSAEEREDMTKLLESGFVDSFRFLYPDKTDAYTYWPYFYNSRGKNIGWRLDYFLVSERIKNKICDVVNRDKVYGSDHCPVIFYGKLS